MLFRSLYYKITSVKFSRYYGHAKKKKFNVGDIGSVQFPIGTSISVEEIAVTGKKVAKKVKKEKVELMNKFKIGDTVTGKSAGTYAYTAGNFEGKVVELNRNIMRVKVTKNRTDTGRDNVVGTTYGGLEQKHFKLVNTPYVPFQKGDVVRITHIGNYYPSDMDTVVKMATVRQAAAWQSNSRPEYSGDHKVLAVKGDYVLIATTEYDKQVYLIGAKGLKNISRPKPEPVVEMTMAELNKAMGKTIKIVDN